MEGSGWKGDLVFGVGFCGNVHGTKVWICGMRMLHGQQAQVFGYLIVFDLSYVFLKRDIFIYDI